MNMKSNYKFNYLLGHISNELVKSNLDPENIFEIITICSLEYILYKYPLTTSVVIFLY